MSLDQLNGSVDGTLAPSETLGFKSEVSRDLSEFSQFVVHQRNIRRIAVEMDTRSGSKISFKVCSLDKIASVPLRGLYMKMFRRPRTRRWSTTSRMRLAWTSHLRPIADMG